MVRRSAGPWRSPAAHPWSRPRVTRHLEDPGAGCGRAGGEPVRHRGDARRADLRSDSGRRRPGRDDPVARSRRPGVTRPRSGWTGSCFRGAGPCSGWRGSRFGGTGRCSARGRFAAAGSRCGADSTGGSDRPADGLPGRSGGIRRGQVRSTASVRVRGSAACRSRRSAFVRVRRSAACRSRRSAACRPRRTASDRAGWVADPDSERDHAERASGAQPELFHDPRPLPVSRRPAGGAAEPDGSSGSRAGFRDPCFGYSRVGNPWFRLPGVRCSGSRAGLYGTRHGHSRVGQAGHAVPSGGRPARAVAGLEGAAARPDPDGQHTSGARARRAVQPG